MAAGARARDRLRLDMNGERDRKYGGGGGEGGAAVFRGEILRCKKYAAENARRGKRRGREGNEPEHVWDCTVARLVNLVTGCRSHGAARRWLRLLSVGENKRRRGRE